MKHAAFLLTLVLCASCQKDPAIIELLAKPSCDAPWLRDKISAVVGEHHLVSVDEYRFLGEYVFAFNVTSDLCDTGTAVFRCNGTQVCGLGGCIDQTDCDGVEFATFATDERVLWIRE